MPDKDEEIIRRQIEGMSKVGHTVTSHNQSGGITAGEVHIHEEDKSLKRQLRNLLAAADSRIPFDIDSGNLNIETRMTHPQFERMNNLLGMQGSTQLVESAVVTGRFTRSTIMDGSYGPNSDPNMVRVKFLFKPEIRE